MSGKNVHRFSSHQWTPMACQLFLVLFLASSLAGQNQESAPRSAQQWDLAVLYAGTPGSPREREFLEFLSGRFVRVHAVPLPRLTAVAAEPYDVVIADWDRGFADPKGRELFRGRIEDDFRKPLIAIGAVGGELFRAYKISWL